MNSITDLGEPVSVWLAQSSDTIPDRSFVPICENGIELNNDYEPVVYRSNRVLMEANAAQELNELQERNHATTAYSTLDCVATPLFPTFNAQRALNCENREDRQQAKQAKTLWKDVIRAEGRKNAEGRNTPSPGFVNNLLYNDPRAQLMPMHAQRPERWVESLIENRPENRIESGAAERSRLPEKSVPFLAKHRKQKQSSSSSSSSFPKKMVNSVRGALYDLNNLKELPPTKDGEPFGSVVKYTLTRDNRGGYLLLWTSIVLLVIILLCIAIKSVAGSM